MKTRGAEEHNLKGADADIGDRLTVVTGVSGSGETSLVFDSLRAPPPPEDTLRPVR